MAKIVYSGSLAQIEVKPSILAELQRRLVWIDRDIIADNKRQRNFARHRDAAVSLIDRKGVFPTGLLPQVLGYLKRSFESYTLERTFKPVEIAPEVELPSWFFEHQVKAIEIALVRKRCLIQLPPSSGKTLIICHLTRYFPKATVLITVPTINILNNIHKELEELLEEPVGRISGDDSRFERITIGVQKSLEQHGGGKYKEQLAAMNVLLSDEAHWLGAPEAQNISRACINTEYRVGLTGTVERADGSTPVLVGMFGPLALDVDANKLAELGIFHKPTSLFINRTVEESVDLAPYKDKYGEIVDNSKLAALRLCYDTRVLNSEDRNNLIVHICKEFLRLPFEHGSPLILCERKEHGKLLASLLNKEEIKTRYLDSSDRDRGEVLVAFREGEVQCLVATKFLNEGEDMPGVELLITAGGMKAKKDIIQKLGRGQRIDRKTGKKRRCLHIDFWDPGIFLSNHSRERRRVIEERFPGCTRIVKIDEAMRVLRDTSHLRED